MPQWLQMWGFIVHYLVYVSSTNTQLNPQKVWIWSLPSWKRVYSTLGVFVGLYFGWRNCKRRPHVRSALLGTIAQWTRYSLSTTANNSVLFLSSLDLHFFGVIVSIESLLINFPSSEFLFLRGLLIYVSRHYNQFPQSFSLILHDKEQVWS